MGTENKGYAHTCDLCEEKVYSQYPGTPFKWTVGNFTFGSEHNPKITKVLLCGVCFPNNESLIDKPTRVKAVRNWMICFFKLKQ